jgi:hypothetical protein
VAWDSYRNGNYDVFARTATGTVWGKELAVAASSLYEAYPSIAYDLSGTLWIAYEEGAEPYLCVCNGLPSFYMSADVSRCHTSVI